MQPDELKQALLNFTGTENHWRHSPNVLLTDGAQFLAEEAGAYWLMDVIASYLPAVPAEEGFLVATLLKYGKDVGANAANFILADDVPANTVYARQHIDYTDFPLDEIKLYVARQGKDWVVMLTSEY